MAIILPGSPERRASQRSSAVVGMDVSNAGYGLENVSKSLSEMADIQNRDELAKAKNKYLILKTEQDSIYDDDEDFKTIPQRYESTLREGISIASQGISDGRVRDSFINDIEVDLAKGKSRILGIAGQKAKDKEISEIKSEMDILRDQALGDGADFGYINASVHERLDAAAQRNVISFEDAQNQKKSFTDNLALGKLKMMGAADRLKALDAPFAKNLPTDTRAILRKEAQDEVRLGKAQDLSVELLSKGMTRVEATKYIFNKYKDPQLRNDAINQFGNLYQSNLLDTAQKERGLHDEYHLGVMSGDYPVAEIVKNNPKDWAEMSPAQRENLAGLESQRASGQARKYSDREVLLKLQWLTQNKNHTEAYDYFTKNSSKLNETDFKQWSKISIEGIVGDEVKPLFNAQKMLETLTENWSADDKVDLHVGLSDWYFDYQKYTGEAPPANITNDHIKEALKSYTTGKFLGFQSGSTPFGLDLENQVDALEYADSIEKQQRFLSNYPVETQNKIKLGLMERRQPEVYQDVLSVFPSGYNPSYKEIESLYINLIQKRELDATQ